MTNTKTTYTAVISEDGDDNARHILIDAHSPEGALEGALKEATHYGYPNGGYVAWVYEGDIGGKTFMRTPLLEVSSFGVGLGIR